MAPTKHELPTGLVYHCDQCGVVIPSDAPKPDEADCEAVVYGKLAWFDPNATVATQFLMAAAAWHLIHDAALKAGHTESTEYRHKFKLFRKEHYEQSATYKALTDDQVKAELEHPLHGRRDRWLYDAHPVAEALKVEKDKDAN